MIVMDTCTIKKQELVTILEHEYRETDLKVSLLNASARSLNWNSNIKPFPPGYLINRDEKDIDALVSF